MSDQMADQFQIQKAWLSSQVTALDFLTEDYLLAGCGPFLRCYQIRSTGHHQQQLKLIWSQPILTQGSRIHGLKLEELEFIPGQLRTWRLIVFGGKSLKWMDVTLSIQDATNPLQITNLSSGMEHHKDWIKDALWIEVCHATH